MNLRKEFFFALFAAVALVFSGCAATSSGSPLGEAAALKYSDEKDKLHFVDMGVVIAGAGEKNKVSSPHHENEISGVAVASNISLLSFDYQLMGQKGGLCEFWCSGRKFAPLCSPWKCNDFRGRLLYKNEDPVWYVF